MPFGPHAMFMLPDEPDAAYRAKLQTAINGLTPHNGKDAAQTAFDEGSWEVVYKLLSDNKVLPIPR